MTATDSRLNSVKQILYVDGDDDDELLSTYITVADSFVRDAIGTNQEFYQSEEVKPRFDLAVESLAASYYENRLALSDTQTYPVDLTVNSIIGQLRGLYEAKYLSQSNTKDNEKPNAE